MNLHVFVAKQVYGNQRIWAVSFSASCGCGFVATRKVWKPPGEPHKSSSPQTSFTRVWGLVHSKTLPPELCKHGRKLQFITADPKGASTNLGVAKIQAAS